MFYPNWNCRWKNSFSIKQNVIKESAYLFTMVDEDTIEILAEKVCIFDLVKHCLIIEDAIKKLGSKLSKPYKHFGNDCYYSEKSIRRKCSIYQSNAYRKQLSWLHFKDELKIQEKQQLKDRQSSISVSVAYLIFSSSS